MSFFTRPGFAPPNCSNAPPRPQQLANTSNIHDNHGSHGHSSVESGHGPAAFLSMPHMLPCPSAPRSLQTGYSSASSGMPDYSEELWKACAGPLVYVPQQWDRVWYFPQGHMEQVAASTQQGLIANSVQQKLPNSGLVSQILCRVVHRVLRAEKETDEVYAQISLLPESNDETVLNGEEPDQEDKLVASPSPQTSSVSSSSSSSQPASASATIQPRMFTKILTASDTSTHGGFSVLRKHAEECLPPLDMNQDTPSQELTATDLHGHKWKFRHTYRGHPRRHLLTTGWSVFVSHKKLITGDAVIFLRGANGELHVGIRRARRQQTVQQAVMSSHSMHMGVVATASHALGTRTMFSVYYKPRVSLSPFLVPVNKFATASSVCLSVGTRFKMRFETEDASDRSYAGTITGIEDLDPVNWPTSKWRSLKVNWDEMFNNEGQDRVSPWEIELCISPPVSNPSPVANPPSQIRNKRFRPAPSSELPGSAKGSTESVYSPKLPRVLQGQEPKNIGMSSLWKSSHGALNNHHNISIQQSQSQQNQLGGSSVAPPSQHRSSFYNPFTSAESDLKLSVTHPVTQNSSGNCGLNHGHVIMQGSAWPSPSTDNWLKSLLPPHASQNTPIRFEKSLVTGNVLPLQSLLVQKQHHAPLSYPDISSFALWETSKQEKGTLNNVTDMLPSPVVAESGCKLFGISLTDSPSVPNGNKHNLVQSGESDEDPNKGEQSQAMEPEMPRSDATSDQLERLDQNTVESRSHSMRSCTKVIKKGSMVGRGIDLTRFDSYDSLFQELEAMFHMEGELTNPEKGWQVAYFDGDGDTMKVGDDPWPEFCGMVKKLYILSPEEVDAGQASERPS